MNLSLLLSKFKNSNALFHIFVFVGTIFGLIIANIVHHLLTNVFIIAQSGKLFQNLFLGAVILFFIWYVSVSFKLNKKNNLLISFLLGFVSVIILNEVSRKFDLADILYYSNGNFEFIIIIPAFIILCIAFIISIFFEKTTFNTSS